MKKIAKIALLLAPLTSSLPLQAFSSGVAKTFLTSLVLFGTQMGRAEKAVHFVSSVSEIDRIGYDLLAQTDANGNDRFVITGSYEYDQIFISTFNDSGIVESTFLLDGRDARSIDATKDGGYLVVSQKATSDFVQVVKLDKSFDVEWTKNIFSVLLDFVYQPYAVKEYRDGSAFAVVGIKKDTTSGDRRLFLWKIPVSGTGAFFIGYGGVNPTGGLDLFVTDDDKVIVAGSLGPGVSTTTGTSLLLAQFNFESANCFLDVENCLSWSTSVMNLDSLVVKGLLTAYSIAETSAGGYVVTGRVISLDRLRSDLFVSLFSSTGSIEFAIQLKDSSVTDPLLYSSEGRAIVEDKDGNFIVTGSYEDRSALIKKLLLLKVGSSGEFIWVKTYHEGAYNIGHSIVLGSRDKIVVTGEMADDDTAIPYLLFLQWSNDGEGCGTFHTTFYTETLPTLRGTLSSSYVEKEFVGAGNVAPLTTTDLDEGPLNMTCVVSTLADIAGASQHSLSAFPLALISTLFAGRWL